MNDFTKGIVLGLPVVPDETGDGITPANWFAGYILDFVFTFAPWLWNGMVFPYEGSYWRGLWDWLTADFSAGDDGGSS